MRSVLSLLLLAGCSVDHLGLVARDAAGVDVSMTPDVNTRLDGGPDFDSAFDARVPDVGGFDAGFDAGNDAGFDAGFDAGNDAGFDAGFDAGNDAGPPDPCTVGNDTDGDGVRDNCDMCPGYNDTNDADGDDIADGCDDWSCGPVRPTAPATVDRGPIGISAVNIHGMGSTATVRPDERFRILFDWFIDDVDCPGCRDQIEWGFTRIGRLGCVYDTNPPTGGVSGSAEIPNIPIPPGSDGVFELRFKFAQQNSCSIRPWYRGEPSEDHTIGYVCVPPPGIEYPGG